MRLSEAIRLGAMSTRQAFGAWIVNVGGTETMTCAIGAVIVAANIERGEGRQLFAACDDLRAIFPELRAPEWACPVCDERHNPIWAIVHLNDGHHWTREAIADHVDRICVMPEQEAEVLVCV